MKKLFTTLNAVLVAAALLLSSCSYDDSGLWGEIDKVKGDVSNLKGDLASLTERVAALEENLEAEVEALKAMVNGLTTVSGCETAANGDVTVSLSNGKSFTVYAEPEHTAVTVYTENGVQYWATVGANDTIVPVKDANGNLVPVIPVKEEAVLPQFTVTEDGKVAVSFDGGVTWSDTGAASTSALEKVSVFSGVEIIKVTNVYGTDITYQAKFTLADGNTFVVDLDPKFYEEYYQTFGTQFQIIDGYSGGQVTSLYVPAGGEDVLQSASGNVVDFLIEKPAGWKVVPEDMREEGEPEAYWVFTVKAPSQEAIDGGLADEVGTVKIVAITGSGKVIPASIEVSANPLKSVSVSGGNISVQTYGSNATYVCGLTPYSAYSEEALSTAVAKLYDYMDWTWTWPEELGVNVQYAGNLEASISDLLGAAQDQSYVFWITFPEQDFESGAVKVDKFTKVVAPYVSVSVLETYAGDAKVSVNIDTTDKFYAATFLSVNSNGQDAATQLKNQLGNLAYYYGEDYNTTLPYEGNLSSLTLFTKQTLTPNTNYTLAVMPYDADKLANNTYTVNDAVMVEFTTALPSVKDATLAKVSISDKKEGASKVQAKITKDLGASFYYVWVDDVTMGTLVSEADQIAYALANGKKSTYTGNQSYTMPAGQTSVTLLVVPFTSDWTYGDVVAEKMSVQPIVYNDIVISINKVELTNGADRYIADHTAANPYFYGYKVEFSATGGTATDYLVYLADTSSNYPYINYFGNSVEGVVPYLVDNPTQSYLKSTAGATTYENVGTKIVKYKSVNYVPTTDDLEYKLIVVAVDADGKYSKPASCSVYYKDFPVPAAN